MKSFPTQLSSIKGIFPNRKADTAIVCGVKSLDIRQTQMEILVKIVKVWECGGERVKAAVELRTMKLHGNMHHF